MQGRHYLPPPEPPTEPEAADGPVSLGSLQVSELFEILIDHHGFTVTGAVRALVVALEQAGYPAETSAVAAADGMEVIQSILDSRT
jgi:hypothetical protein